MNHIKIYIPTIKNEKKKKKKYKSYTQGDNGNWNPGVMIQQLCERYSWTSYGTDTNRHTTIGKNFIIN